MSALRTSCCALALVLLGSCSPAGRVALRFSFVDLPDDLTGLFFHVQIRNTDGDVLSGSVTAATKDARFQLSVPNGDNRVAIVELRDSASPTTSNVIAYGVSAPFSIQPGDDEVIEARIVMRRVPSIVTLAAPDTVRTSAVPIVVTSDRDGLAQIVLAQDPSLTFGRQVYDAAPGLEQSVSYDIDAACRAAASCADGRRNVFARLIDDSGYSSTATSTPIVVDTRPPSVLVGSGSVRFEAPAGLLTPTAAGRGVTVVLSFVFDEPVTSTPSVTLEGSGLAFDLVTTALGAYVFQRVVTDSDPAGLQRPLVRARDRAGNEAPVAAPDLEYVVDHVRPAAPNVDVPDAIVYRRDPYRDVSEGGASFTVVGAAGAVEAGARVVVYDRAEAFVEGAEVANRAGATYATADGSFVADLAPVDLEDVYLLVLDAAGNFHDPAGRAVRVRDAEWRVPGGVSAGARPPVDVFTVDRMTTTTRFDRAGIVAVDGAPLAIADASSLEAHYDPRWTEIIPAASAVPDALRFAAATHDPARGRTIVYGGRSAGNLARRTTWEWDGRRWQTFPSSTIEPRCEDGSAPGDDPFGYFAYHGALGRSLLVCRFLSPRQPPPLPAGGTDELRAYGWNGAEWGAVAIEGPGPAGRVGHALTYDPSRGRALLFGGNSGTLVFVGAGATTLGDTWELEAVPTSSVGVAPTMRWIEHRPVTTPPARDRHAMVYAPTLGGVVMFGGISAATDRHALDDLWIWDGVTWAEVPKNGAWPPARALHTLVFDPVRGAVGVLGGLANEPTSDDVDLLDSGFDDAWWWDGASWTQTATAAASPRGPGLAATGDHTTGDVVVLSSVAPNDPPSASRTFVVNPRRWDDRTPSSSIPPDSNLEVASYDPGRDVLWHHATRPGGSPGTSLSETWQWTDSGWRFVVADPQIAASYSSVFDLGRERLFLIGHIPGVEQLLGYFEHGEAGWMSSTSTGGPPSFVNLPNRILIYDHALDRPVIHGFSDFVLGQGHLTHELWARSPTSDAWTPLFRGPNPFPVGNRPAIAYDARTGGYLLQVEEISVLRFETLTFDGTTWTSRTGSEGDWTSRRGLVTDLGRQRILTIGALSGRARVWEWHDAYVERATAGTPPSRFVDQTIAYDPRRRRVLVNESTEALEAPAGAMYTLDVDPDARPAVVARVRLDAGGVAPGTIRSIRIETSAGGGGYAGVDTTRIDGAELALFSPRSLAWVPLAANAAAENEPAPIVRSLDLDETRAVTRADAAELLVAVRSAAALGGGIEAPAVRVDRLDVVVTYRR